MSHFLNGILPEDLGVWRVEAMTFQHRTLATARRGPVTLKLVCDETGWWYITKMRGGQVLAEKTVRRLPAHALEAIETARRR